MFLVRVKVRKKDFCIVLAGKQQKYRATAPLSTSNQVDWSSFFSGVFWEKAVRTDPVHQCFQLQILLNLRLKIIWWFLYTLFFTICSFIVSFPFSTVYAFKCEREVIIFSIVAVNPNNWKLHDNRFRLNRFHFSCWSQQKAASRSRLKQCSSTSYWSLDPRTFLHVMLIFHW